ncbi:MAG: 2-C-methyl-D-erythritol 4-phosphate cytidylyltransferase [Candidatus Omnitrophica bacterium]|nr:2-C-methyl-D-erythritol 4-phosphate cytidylyltransferase [Candidatus Omnitrophota bacterium]
MKIQVIIPTAGLGKRFNSDTPKTLLELKGRLVFLRSCEVFEDMVEVESIILVVHEDYISEYTDAVKQSGFKKIKKIVSGGSTRTGSVRNGLKELDEDTEVVVIHDGARPLLDKQIAQKAIAMMAKTDALVVAVRVKPTIKEVDPQTLKVKRTLDRRLLWDIQTPQVFKKDLIVTAYQSDSGDMTDDASMVEKMGKEVIICEGSYRNIKITTPEDMSLATILLGLDHG